MGKLFFINEHIFWLICFVFIFYDKDYSDIHKEHYYENYIHKDLIHKEHQYH